MERMLAKIVVDEISGCHLWQGELSDEGYGLVSEGGKNGGRRVKAHRAMWELVVGPIPAGLTLDHVAARGCVHRHCVNTAHLEPVPIGVNVLRGNGPSAANARKTRCSKGHPFDNVTRRGKRECIRCRRESARRRYRERKNTT